MQFLQLFCDFRDFWVGRGVWTKMKKGEKNAVFATFLKSVDQFFGNKTGTCQFWIWQQRVVWTFGRPKTGHMCQKFQMLPVHKTGTYLSEK